MWDIPLSSIDESVYVGGDSIGEYIINVSLMVSVGQSIRKYSIAGSMCVCVEVGGSCSLLIGE